jgi:peroxiredoxin
MLVNKINELKSELNLQNLQVWSNFPGIDHKACMRSIKLFNDEGNSKNKFRFF